ncbi:MAG: hypothetical protein PHU70_01225 [Dehalococcoidia bacterium]|nr:hypothetical protein [Dehalococcoidia bacterium]
MKSILLIGALTALFAAGLLAGCSQPAAVTPDQSQPAETKAATADAAPTGGPAVSADSGTRASPEQTAVDGSQAASIAEILQDPRGWDGKKVIVEGKIASECPSGCWFTLKDGNAVIYIDLAPSNLVIPQRKGSYTRVTARVVAEGSDVYLIGTNVEF